MASAAQVVANGSNAQKSTGPRTPEGKAVVSQNAVKHGLLARQVVIRGEDPGEDEVVLGQVVMTDFARAKVLDRLLVYERRIENSLYRTMAEFQKHKRLREQEPPAAEAAARAGSSGKREVSSLKQETPSRDCGLQTSNFALPTSPIASADATANAAAAADRPQHSRIPSFRHSSHRPTADPVCKTKPMCGGADRG